MHRKDRVKMKKKIIYAILICIIIAGIVIIPTIGLKADLMYSKNVEIDVYLGKSFSMSDMEQVVGEVFPGEKTIIQEIELFGDMAAITIPDTRSDEELNSKVEELNTKINEKFELENEVDDLTVTHNPKVKLSSLVMPYLWVIGTSVVIILVFAAIRYRKLGVVKMLLTYIFSIAGVQLLLLSIIAITRFPVNRAVIPVGLLLYVATVTVLGIKNEKKLTDATAEEEK